MKETIVGDLLDPQNVAELRAHIRKQLSTLRIDEQVKDLLKQAQDEGRDVLAEEALERVRSLGVIDRVVSSVTHLLQAQSEGAAAADLGGGPAPSASQLRAEALRSHDHRYLFLRVRGGFGFTQYIVEPPSMGDALVVCGSFLGQRFVSKPAPAAIEPRLDVGALIKLPGGRAGGVDEILAQCPEARLHLSVIKISARPGELMGDPDQAGPGPGTAAAEAQREYDPLFGPLAKGRRQQAVAAARVGRRELVGSGLLDWRKALVSGVGRQLTCTVEVLSPLGGGGIGSGPLVPSGSLDVKLEILPAPGAALDPQEFRALQRSEATSDAHKATALMARARSWFTEVSTVHPVIKERQVLLVAYGEDGVQRPVTSFVSPGLLPPRSLPTARHAARFMSLLGSVDESRVLGPLGAHCVAAPQTMAAAGRGTGLDKAILLASLLRGYALNAWVCIGSDPKGPKFWALTTDRATGGAFWEPLTGRRYPLSDVVRPGGSPYVTLDSIFNHEKVLVNVQRDNILLTCSLDFDDLRSWRSFRAGSEETPGVLGPEGTGAPLAYPPFSIRDSAPQLTASLPQIEAGLESELKFLLERFRNSEMGLRRPDMTWSPILEPLLMPALEAYEREAVTGAPYPGSEEFTEGIKSAVPQGHTFQGFPTHHTTLDPSSIAAAIVKQAPAIALLKLEGSTAAFALRCAITAYAEDVCSVWVMIAASVQPEDPGKRVAYRPAANVQGRREAVGQGLPAAAGAAGVGKR